MFICYPMIYDMTMLALVSYMKILIEWKYPVYPDSILNLTSWYCFRTTEEDTKKSGAEVESHWDLAWPVGGRKCEVAACDTEAFPSHDQYMVHWTRVHDRYLIVRKCSVCKVVRTSLVDMITHLEKNHGMSTAEASVEGLACDTYRYNNKEYVSPRGVQPPIPPSLATM
jgi:hypothetical protein